jgi:hypothetical protein
VRAVLSARRAAGVTSRSGVEIHKADDECYAAVVTGHAGALAVRMGGGGWSPPGGNWGHAASGGKRCMTFCPANSPIFPFLPKLGFVDVGTTNHFLEEDK